MIQLGWAAAVAVVSLVSKLLSAPYVPDSSPRPPRPPRAPYLVSLVSLVSLPRRTFHPAACERFEESVNHHLVGQEPAVRVLSDAICDFLVRRSGGTGELDASPLVVSLHGPPGVGKTYFHKLAARALYGVDERCPGRGCPGYKVGRCRCKPLERSLARSHSQRALRPFVRSSSAWITAATTSMRSTSCYKSR